MEKFLFLVLIFVTSIVIAQPPSNFNSSKNWSLNKKEVFFAVGATQFLSDLGGRDRIGTQKSPVDIDWVETKMGFGIGYRYRFHPWFSTSTQLYAGMLSADDANTGEIIRNSRNLSVRTPVLELSQRIEFILVSREKVGARYQIAGMSYMRPKNDQFYLFTGAGVFWFNPQTKINGQWENLHPLKTEGQGLPGGVDPYSRINVSIPFGMGVKLGIGQYWQIGLEVSYHKTFTDYMDDVSTDYYDPEILGAQIGPNAVYAANPAKANHNWFAPGQQRGNPDDNDAFFLANIVLVRNITYPKTKKTKSVKWKGRTKF